VAPFEPSPGKSSSRNVAFGASLGQIPTFRERRLSGSGVEELLCWPTLAYTPAMMRLIFASLGLSLILSTTSLAQVKISVPGKHHNRKEEIHAKVENAGRQPITLCVGFAGISGNTPSPFWAQRNNGRKWSTLLLGSDIGPAFGSAVVLEAGQSEEFLLQLNESGNIRLRLDYWRGAIPNLACASQPKGSHVATSASFTIE